MRNEFLTALGISVGAMFPIINPVVHAPTFYAMTPLSQHADLETGDESEMRQTR